MKITLCQQHLRPSQTQRQGKLGVHMRLVMYHDLSRTQPKLEGKCVSVGVDALAVVVKTNSHVCDGSTQNKDTGIVHK